MRNDLSDFVPHQAGEFNLFDIQAAPYEQNDLAGDASNHERVNQFRREMHGWWTKTGGKPIPPPREMELK